MAKRMTIDKEKVKELYFYIINDSDIYFKFSTPYIESLTKKYVKDTFDKKKAIKGWSNVTRMAVSKYTRDYGSPGTFNSAEKEMLGAMLYDYYEDIMKANFKKARKLKKNN